MIDLYYWPTPNGWKISIALEEMELPYRMIPVDIGKGDQFAPEFLAVGPNGKMPAIVDHDPAGGGAPIPVFESGAILLYLADKTGRFLPRDVRGRSHVVQWLMWQMGGLGPMLGQHGHFALYAKDKIEYAIRRYRARDRAAIRRARPAPRGSRPHLRRLLDRRHGVLALGRHQQGAVDRSRRLSERAALVRRAEGAPCPATRVRARPGTPGLAAQFARAAAAEEAARAAVERFLGNRGRALVERTRRDRRSRRRCSRTSGHPLRPRRGRARGRSERTTRSPRLVRHSDRRSSSSGGDHGGAGGTRQDSSRAPIPSRGDSRVVRGDGRGERPGRDVAARRRTGGSRVDGGAAAHRGARPGHCARRAHPRTGDRARRLRQQPAAVGLGRRRRRPAAAAPIPRCWRA